MATFWSFKDEVAPGVDELRIDGEIVDDEEAWLYEWFELPHTSPNMLRNELNARKGRAINVWINSYGGSVFAAAGIYNALKEHTGVVTTIVDGIAASAASVIAMAGERVEITPVGMLMIHDPITSLEGGRASQFRRTADVLDKVKETIVNAYTVKTGLDRQEIARMMEEETYMTPMEAVRLGFADTIRNANSEKQASLMDCTAGKRALPCMTNA